MILLLLCCVFYQQKTAYEMRISDWSSDVCSSDLGATASVKGFANSSSFAIGKFGLRGLAQSAARELAPKGIHVAHFVIDGGVRSAARPDPADRPDSTLDPDGIAQSYLAVLAQPRSAWSWEVELRPWVESFRSEEHTSELQSLMRISYAV